MNSPQQDTLQMEFGFAEAVTGKRRKGKARKSAAQGRAEKLTKATGTVPEVTLKSPSSALQGDAPKPTARMDWADASGALGSEWIEGVCGNIRSANDLREALALSACYLTDLIDREIDGRGHNEAWKQEYEAYCWAHYFRLTIETETELEELRALWWMAGIVLNTDNGAKDRSDWELFEDLCELKTDFSDLDGEEAEAALIEFLAFFLSELHAHLFGTSGETLTERHPDSKP
jgi:hypothetical protein